MAKSNQNIYPYIVAIATFLAGGGLGYNVAPSVSTNPGQLIPDQEPCITMQPVVFLAELINRGHSKSYWYYVEAEWDKSLARWRVSRAMTTPRVGHTIVTFDWIKANGGIYLPSPFITVFDNSGNPIGAFLMPQNQRKPTGDAPVGSAPAGSVGKAPPDA